MPNACIIFLCFLVGWLVQISRIHPISAALQLCPLDQYLAIKIPNIRFTSCSRVQSWSNLTRVCLDPDHFTRTFSGRLYCLSYRCTCCALTCTSAENTAGLNLNRLNAAAVKAAKNEQQPENSSHCSPYIKFSSACSSSTELSSLLSKTFCSLPGSF